MAEGLLFSIADIAARTGLSQDTIRYYEKIGLLPTANRKENGQREYSQPDLDRFTFVSNLKRTSMPLKEINRYMSCLSVRDYEGCYGVLYDHKIKIESQMADMRMTLEMMNFKLDNYQSLIKSEE